MKHETHAVHSDAAGKRNGRPAQGSDSPVVQAMIHQPPSPTDPMGMYTGKPVHNREKPVQDADDL